MRNEKVLINILKKFVEVVYEECDKSPDFAQKIDKIISEVPQLKSTVQSKKKKDLASQAIVQLYNEWHLRGEDEFMLWLMEQPVPVLQATIKSYELDTRKQSSKWTDAKKLADFIVEKLRNKVLRGSSFIKSIENTPVSSVDNANGNINDNDRS